MKVKEANEIIAKFMGEGKVPLFAASADREGKNARFTNRSKAVVQHFLDDDPNGYHRDHRVVDWSYYFQYSKMLDFLAPVWKELTVTRVILNPRIGQDGETNYVEIEVFADKENILIEFNDDINKAACIATAKAIQSLKPKEEV